MEGERELDEIILVLRMSLAHLNELELEMDLLMKDMEIIDKLKKITDIFPDSEKDRVKAKEFFDKRLNINTAKTKMENLLFMVTKPCSLLELSMEKVVEVNITREELPKTLELKVLEWPTKKIENTRKKLFIIDQHNFDELNFIIG
eukprot:GFUD01139066.1.p1 GENE.GFUD01139066.1~~GFUD01139066.1.p1  ORF type:complete len:146 (-),score=31.79 GFUD01139066.1:80-517(-)